MNCAKQGFKGAVRRMFMESSLHTGWRTSEEQHFDRDGNLTAHYMRAPGRPEIRRDYRYDEGAAPADPRVRVSQNADGGRTETEELPPESALWTREGLHDVSFNAGGAKYAETTFDPHGSAIRTAFRDHLGEDLSELHYTCDEKGNILEAREAGHPLAWFRVTFRYDGPGHVLEQAIFFGEDLQHNTVNRYNDQGDTVWSKTGDNPPAELEYEYDEQGNWTRQVTHHSLGADEVRRRIEYWPR